jgi:hypothetical protein
VQGQAQGDGTTSLNESFERMLASDIEKELDAIERGPEMAPTVEGSAITDMAEVRSLFAELAAGYVRPVRDFLIDLRWGEATVEWIDICEPSLRSLRRAAERLELTELCQALDVFSGALAATKTSGSRAIEGEHRAALLACQEKLADVMPQAFALENERSQRESVILHALLLQIPNVTKLTLDRVYGAGLNSLEAMCLASAADLAATTGIDPALAGRIVARFREYHAQARALVPDAAHAAERERIRTLLARLKVENDEYEAAAGGWSHEATVKKKELRATRMRTLLDLQVLLARLGEVERLKELERLPFERKLSYLESFLEEARKKYAAQP